MIVAGTTSFCSDLKDTDSVLVEPELFTEGYEVPPKSFHGNADSANPFAELPEEEPLRDQLEEYGVTFPDDAMVTNSGLPFAGIVMRNTRSNHRLLEEFLTEKVGRVWSRHEFPRE